MDIEKVAVSPVPDSDCTWAVTLQSHPWVMGNMARCWMAEGFSKSKRQYEIS